MFFIQSSSFAIHPLSIHDKDFADVPNNTAAETLPTNNTKKHQKETSQSNKGQYIHHKEEEQCNRAKKKAHNGS